MKRLAILLVAVGCLGLASSTHATDCSSNALGGGWTCVQSKGLANGSGSTSAPTLAYTSNVTSGDLLYVDVGWFNVNTTVTPTDTQSSSWTCGAVTKNTTGNNYAQDCWALAGGTGADTITYTFGLAVTYAVLVQLEFSGNAASSFLDKTNTVTTGTSIALVTTPTVNTGFTDELLIVCTQIDASAPTLTAGSDTAGSAGAYTLYPFANGADGGGCELIGNASIGAHNGTATWSSAAIDWIGGITTFKNTASVPPAPPPPVLTGKITGQIISGPLFPAVVPNSTYPPDTGYTITPVSSGANLQTAINAAACGTKLNLAHDGTWAAGATPYTLPNKSCACHTDPTKYVIIQSDAFQANYTRGIRLDPSAQYHNLAHISSSDTNYTFTAIGNGSSCYGFGGLDVTETANLANSIFEINDGSQTPANYAHDFIFWWDYIHGISTLNLTRLVILNGNFEAIVDSYLSDGHKVGQEAQCIGGWDGFGGVLIQNNFCSGAGENFIEGGSDPQVGTMPSDFSIVKNHFFKPVSWNQNDPTYVGIHWLVKNIFELKEMNRAVIWGNVFQNNWPDGQNGVSLPFDDGQSGGTNPINTNQDINFYWNILQNATAVGNIATAGAVYPENYPDHRFSFHDNLYTGIDGCIYGGCLSVKNWTYTGIPVGSLFAPFDIWMNHETIASNNMSTGAIWGSTPGMDLFYGIQLRNSVIDTATNGAFFGNGAGAGNNVITNYTPGANFTNNCAYGSGGGIGNLPNFAGSVTVANQAAVFVAPGSNYAVAGGSACHAIGSDGLDPGANISAVNAATSGVVQTLANVQTVTNVSPSTFTHLGGTGITITGTNFIQESGIGVIIGGAGPAVSELSNSCGFASPGQFTVTVFTDTTHFTYTGPCNVVTNSPITLAVNDTVNVTVNAALTGGNVNRSSPGNACTSVVVVSPTSITCTTPAATGTVTNGLVSIFVSQFGIPVQSTVFGTYN